MKAVSRESSQPHQQPTQPPPPSAEDEALKRNTDCVYFLASPLTCKKGEECEYRHSEPARMNPRDCWYWVNGNCLNPKCSYRHPPLDGLVGTPVAASVRPPLPPTIPLPSTQYSAPNNAAYTPFKQSTQCYYFQQGLCLKGDRCAFMHGSLPTDHAAPQPPVQKIATPAIEPQTLKKPIWSLDKCNQQKNFPQDNVMKPVVQPPVKPQVKAMPTSFQNGNAAEKSKPPVPLDHEISRYKPASAPSVISGNSVGRTHHVRQAQALDDRNFRNGKEPDELGESSPGFDVLVDDELLESDYYEKEDDYGRMSGHGGRPFNNVNEIDYGRSDDYRPVAKFDRDTYSDSRGYDTYGKTQDRYAREHGREHGRGSSERISDRPYVPERRVPRVRSPEQIDELDLRHRLSKQRRVNGSRSAVSPDSRSDFYRREDRERNVEDQRYQGHARRDSRHLPHESSISNRLQGRISLPGRSSPDRSRNDSHSEKDLDRGRKWGRLSPGRPPISSHSGRSQERSRRRVDDEPTPEGRSLRAPFVRRDEPDNTLDFAGPKRLVELKKAPKLSERDEEQQSRGLETSSGDRRNIMNRKLESRQVFEESSSFEGPKPLREILKRKRQEKTVSEGGSGEDNQNDMEENSKTVASGKGSDMASEVKEETSYQHPNGTVDEEEEEEEEGLITEETEGEQPPPAATAAVTQKGSEVETEDMIMLENAEDEEFETSDQRDVESDYEQVEEDYKGAAEEEGNGEAEEEYYDDEDGEDDFAKRIGVMFS